MTTARPSFGFRLIAVGVIVLVRLLGWRIRTDGLVHVPRQGGAVLIWNHTGHLDLIVTMYHVYRRLGRSCRFLAVRELWDHKGFGWLARLSDALPVDRSSPQARARSFDHAVAALRAGQLIMVAPEGRISSSFEVLAFRPGAVRMAQAAAVPVVPSVSWGSHRASTTGRPFSLRRARRLPVLVRFGAPVHVGPDEDVAQVGAALRTTMAAMLDEVQRAYPDGAPAGAWWVPARLGGGAPPLHDAAAGADESSAPGQSRADHEDSETPDP